METAMQNRERKFKKESFLRIRHFAKKKKNNQPTESLKCLVWGGRLQQRIRSQPTAGLGSSTRFCI